MKTRTLKTAGAIAIFVVVMTAQSVSAYYNPSTARWLSRDPVEESGGANFYCFVANDSLSRIDGLGQIAVTVASDGIDFTLAGVKHHVGLEGGSFPFEITKSVDYKILGGAGYKISGSVDVTVLNIPGKECQVKSTPVTDNSKTHFRFHPLPPAIIYTVKRKQGEALEVTGETEAAVSFPNITITASDSIARKQRVWCEKCQKCFELNTKATGAFSGRISYIPIVLASAPVGAVSSQAEREIIVEAEPVFAQ